MPVSHDKTQPAAAYGHMRDIHSHMRYRRSNRANQHWRGRAVHLANANPASPPLRPGVRQMMDAIHAEGKERGAVQDCDGVALIHAEVPIKEHLGGFHSFT